MLYLCHRSSTDSIPLIDLTYELQLFCASIRSLVWLKWPLTIALSICTWFLTNQIGKNSGSRKWIFGLFQTGFLLSVQPAKINFEIDFCRLKIQFVELDFSKIKPDDPIGRESSNNFVVNTLWFFTLVWAMLVQCGAYIVVGLCNKKVG